MQFNSFSVRRLDWEQVNIIIIVSLFVPFELSCTLLVLYTKFSIFVLMASALWVEFLVLYSNSQLVVCTFLLILPSVLYNVLFLHFKTFPVWLLLLLLILLIPKLKTNEHNINIGLVCFQTIITNNNNNNIYLFIIVDHYRLIIFRRNFLYSTNYYRHVFTSVLLC